MQSEHSRDRLAMAVVQSVPYPLFVLDEAGNYVDIFGGEDRSLYDTPRFLVGRNLSDVLPRHKMSVFLNTIRLAIETDTLQVLEYELASSDCAGSPQDGPAGVQRFEGRVFPLKLDSAEKDFSCRRLVLWAALNITQAKCCGASPSTEAGEEIIQICLFCKNVRNAKNKWERLEAYLEKSTHLRFSHGMCPSCAQRRYADLLAGHDDGGPSKKK